MIVRDNFNGRRAARYFGSNQSKLGKTLEKLASGYQINRSADDAAGLAISEKMRLQITGQTRAHLNSIEGSRLIQTGEGALQEIQDMLDRAEYLAGESANGTYNDTLDRENLQDELDQICAEIDRITTSTNFNGISLFQDEGPEYESSKLDESLIRFQTVQNQLGVKSSAVPSGPSPAIASNTSLDELLDRSGLQKGKLNIVYIENDAVNADPAATGTPTTPTVNIGGTSVDLGDILKKQILPNVVKNITENYPAFSYLNGSTIGIGLEYFHGNGTNKESVLAYVGAGVEHFPNGKGGSLSYTLGVNLDKITAWNDQEREDLEATIAHEMVHAFMDEATTAGMFGIAGGAASPDNEFPKWFVEGMAQTASGHNGWVSMSAANGLNIEAGSTDDTIKKQIQNNRLGSNTTGSQYGTGYLACMYLGAAKACGGKIGSTPITASLISAGLTELLNDIIGGKSLNEAIVGIGLSGVGCYTDFEDVFNNGTAAGMCDFVRDLLTVTGSGRGGLVTGDLTATDLAANADITGVKLFELDPTNSEIKNTYPNDYQVISGGTSTTGGTAPTDFVPGTPPTLGNTGDFAVYGDPNGFEYDPTTKTLTITAGNGITVSMKSPAQSDGNIVIKDGVSKVTLNGVNTTGKVTVQGDSEISYKGKNTVGDITLEKTGSTTTFSGTGQLKTGTFTSDASNKITFKEGAVIVGGGTGTINGNVTVDDASVAANLTPTGNVGAAEFPWDKIGLNEVQSVKINSFEVPMLLDSGDPGKLWLEITALGSDKVTFIAADGTKKTLNATWDPASNQFKWSALPPLFTVTGGVEGTDYAFEGENSEILVIKTNTAMTITSTSGNKYGRIKLADNISGTVDLTLNGVDCSENKTGSGFDLGAGNDVKLTLADESENKFTGAARYAGIALGDKTALTINGGTGKPKEPGKLEAEAGADAAGIGRNGASKAAPGKDKDSSITINGGIITATGKSEGAGIGAGSYNDIGSIAINGGDVTATGGSSGGAGIGGAYYASCGTIDITEGSGKQTVVEAKSLGHGAGIGGGWYNTSNGKITISGGDITAVSLYHGTGIGAGCQGSSGTSYTSLSETITITGTAHIKAKGGDEGAGIGASCWGTCQDIVISGKAVIDEARGGDGGAGIGSGHDSTAGSITIETEGTVKAYGGRNGVGIGSGYVDSTVGDITILKGTVSAEGGENSTGIGAGRDSTSKNITIGTDGGSEKIVVDAKGGMTNDGGNIMSYTDPGHNNPGTVKITGNGTSVRPGEYGEGLYSTSGVTDKDGKKLYSYPVFLFEHDPDATGNDILDNGVGKDVEGLLPLDKDKVELSSVRISSDKTTTPWTAGLSHAPLEDDYAFVWLTPEDQMLTISYEEDDGSGGTTPKTVELDLVFYPDSGKFRIKGHPVPPPAEKPEYIPDPPPTPVRPDPTKPDSEKPGTLWPGYELPEKKRTRGIILQIGANKGEILEVPVFYISKRALGLDRVDISTQQNALDSMAVLKNAINRVSSIRGDYGALQNRLEHNQNDLSQATENLTDAESRIRDADMASEYTKYVALNILQQSSQAMLAHANQDASRVTQLFQS